MHGNISVTSGGAISAAATFSRQRQFSAEPLWFAVMCRHLWGTNATKELQFLTERSERTCRAWASGDSLHRAFGSSPSKGENPSVRPVASGELGTLIQRIEDLESVARGQAELLNRVDSIV